MKLSLSPRLLACAAMVPPGARVADIGCDHGYLSIHLLQQGIAQSVIASDINPGPLDSARANAARYGVAEKLRFFLTDGVSGLPREFDTLVCAGMGGDTMVHILRQAPWLRGGSYRLVLQCQSRAQVLRAYLSDAGWRILREQAVRDGRFLYTVMQVAWDPEAPRLAAAETWYPPAMVADGEGEAYRQWVLEGLRIATAHRPDPEKLEILARLRQD